MISTYICYGDNCTLVENTINYHHKQVFNSSVISSKKDNTIYTIRDVDDLQKLLDSRPEEVKAEFVKAGLLLFVKTINIPPSSTRLFVKYGHHLSSTDAEWYISSVGEPICQYVKYIPEEDWEDELQMAQHEGNIASIFKRFPRHTAKMAVKWLTEEYFSCNEAAKSIISYMLYISARAGMYQDSLLEENIVEWYFANRHRVDSIYLSMTLAEILSRSSNVDVTLGIMKKDSLGNIKYQIGLNDLMFYVTTIGDYRLLTPRDHEVIIELYKRIHREHITKNKGMTSEFLKSTFEMLFYVKEFSPANYSLIWVISNIMLDIRKHESMKEKLFNRKDFRDFYSNIIASTTKEFSLNLMFSLMDSRFDVNFKKTYGSI